MKTLYVLRHAKSSWNTPGQADFDRPLNERGKRDAPAMGALMKEKGFEPDLILSSPAQRAKETARLVKEAAGFTAEIKFEPGIYEASLADLLKIISEVEAVSEKVLLVGHNPGLEHLLMSLTGEMNSMPTAALAEIELAVEQWSEIIKGGKLKNLFKPKEI
jgi:phosphohistidine phosphatase